MEGTEIRKIAPDELGEDFLDGFRRIQRITELWVREETGYVLRPAQLLYEWSDEKRRWIPLWLKEQAERGGAVFGAFRDGKLVGFSSIDGTLAGESTRIANLTMLFVDDRFKRRGDRDGTVPRSLPRGQEDRSGSSVRLGCPLRRNRLLLFPDGMPGRGNGAGGVCGYGRRPVSRTFSQRYSGVGRMILRHFMQKPLDF